MVCHSFQTHLIISGISVSCCQQSYVVGPIKVNFLSYRYRADKSAIFGMTMRGLWGHTINSGRGAMLNYL